jgi:hypothetical protein
VPHQQASRCLSLLAGGILIEVALQGSQAAMAADLGHLAQAQAGLVGSGEGGAAEAVGAHALDAHLLGQLGDGYLSAPDAERLASLARGQAATVMAKLMHLVVRALLGGALLLHPHRPRRPPKGTQYPEIHSRQSKGSRGA